MPSLNTTLLLPEYYNFIDSIAALALPISGSELHGMMCGYLCAGATREGEAYLRALMSNNKDAAIRTAMLALFEVYAISQQQIANFDFEFQLLLPNDDMPLDERAKAFCECCEGFVQAITMAGIDYEQLQEEDSQEALRHLTEFAQLDYHALQADEDDERALMEVSEYARMAMLRIYSDLLSSTLQNASLETAH